MTLTRVPGMALQAFIRMNRRACWRVAPAFPQSKLDIFGLYELTVARFMSQEPGQVVVDVGGGRSCPFAKYRSPRAGTKIICMDISIAEMEHNHDVDERRVCDITRTLPCEDAEADLIVSRSVLEHIEDLSLFVGEARRVLKADGLFIHLFPCKFAPFALLNQALPRRVSGRLLRTVFSDKKGILGFPAVYNRCYPSAISRLLGSHGFGIEKMVLSYRQSGYFDFFFPAYLGSACYEAAVQWLSLKNLCAYVLVVARKTGGG